MSTPKGWSSQEKEDRLKPEFTTVGPVGQFQHGLETRTKNYHSAATDAVEAGSTTSVLNFTAHVIKKGDVLRFTSGVNQTVEVDVVEVDTNTVTLGQTLGTAPGAGDAVDILRPTSLTLTSSGGFSSVVSFTLDGSTQAVTEDTVTPANNRPLPVKLVDTGGDISINVANQNINVQTTHVGADADSMRIGDGTETVNVNASNEMQVADDTARTSLSNIDTDTTTIAGDTTSIDGKMAAFDLDTGGGTENVQGVVLRTESAGGSVQAGTASDPLRTDPTGSTTQPISAASLPLPTGAATEATLSSIDGNITACNTGAVTISTALPAGTNNIGDVDIASALPAGTNNIGDVDIASALPAGTNNIGDVDIASALPAGTNNIGDVDIASALPAGTNTIGAVNLNRLDVVDFLDTALTDASTINGSAGAFVQVVASLASDVEKIQVMDTGGVFMGIYTGPAASEVLAAIYGPGSDQTVEVAIASGTRISLRSMETAGPSAGDIAFNFLG